MSYRRFLMSSCVALTTLTPTMAEASDDSAIESRMVQMEAELRAQRALIAAQAAMIQDQQHQIDALAGRSVASTVLGDARGAGTVGASQSSQPPATSVAQAPPASPVGEAPDIEPIETTVEAVPQGQGVLTPAGRLVFDPSIEYTNASNNRLVFRGIELIPGIQFGVIEASDVDRETIAATATLRYGLTNRIEVEGRLPFLLRSDRIEVVQQRDGAIVRLIRLKERNIGDIEFAARYQLNRPLGQRPIFVAGVRVKSNTGKSPFGIPYDSFGIATGLATGSGFWAVQPSLNMLLPSDPAVIFGGVSYLYHMARNIDQDIGDARVGRVDPGDAISANIGFGFALNPRFSYSLGYRHNYILSTTTELGETTQRSSRLHVGALSFGMSYRLTPRQSISLGFDFGVTEDAPDLGISLRMPFSLGVP